MKLKITLLSALSLYFSLMLATVQAKQVTIKNLLAIQIADWDGDASRDKAVLALPENDNDNDNDNENDDGAVLYIYLSNNDQGKVIVKKNIAWAGRMWGTTPTLSMNKVGSLIIQSMNDAIGRNRWHQNLTVSYRNKVFIVSGYSYSSHDTLQKQKPFECDVNLLTGKGIVNGKSFRIAKQKILLKDWNEDLIPKRCLN